MMVDAAVVRGVDEVKLLCSLHEVVIMSKVMVNHVRKKKEGATRWENVKKKKKRGDGKNNTTIAIIWSG